MDTRLFLTPVPQMGYNMHMNKHTKIILWGLCFLFAASVIFAYFRFYVAGDYIIHTEISCDPAEEACFVYECDPEAEECTGDPEEDTWYYKMISKRAAFMPVCDADDEECPEPTCSIGETDCEIVTCSEETLADAGEGIYCSDPADFQDEESEEGTEEEMMEEGSAEGEEGMEESSEEASEGEGENASDVEEAPAEENVPAGDMVPASEAGE